jgi:hypothetical protein
MHGRGLEGIEMRASWMVCLALLLTACVGRGQTGSQPGRDGWITLFNGRDLTGWTKMHAGNWTVENGVLTYTGGGNGWLRSNETFDDFHLIAEWRYPVAEGEHDAGLFFRAGAEGAPWPRPAYQMNMGPGDDLGSVGGIASAPKRPDLVNKPGGDWNTYELLLVGDKALALINGRKAWDAHGFTRADGHIGVQCEGSAIEVRSVRVRRLSAAAR